MDERTSMGFGYRTTAIVLGSLFLATTALGSGGVLEINQTCAVETGCFPGDSPGFPVEITQTARNFRLTSDLRLDNPFNFDENSTAVEISVDRVTLDLGGFEIRGPCLSFCEGGGGTGDGVSAAAFVEGVEVHSGSVNGMGRNGVAFGPSGIARDLRVSANRGNGILVGGASVVLESTSQRNGLDGIAAGDGSAINGNTSRFNGGAGISVDGLGGQIGRNSVQGNSGDGIRTTQAAVITDNSAFNNLANGIVTGTGSSVVGNTAFANGTGVVGDGIRAGVGSSVRDNSARFNKGFGMTLTQAGYSGCVISGNTGGTVSGGVDLGGNYCPDTFTGTCP